MAGNVGHDDRTNHEHNLQFDFSAQHVTVPFHPERLLSPVLPLICGAGLRLVGELHQEYTSLHA